jgi:cytochrome c556
LKKLFVAVVLLSGLAATPVALSHLDVTAFSLSYRQSLFAVLGANFGPMSSMIKGELPWNDEAFQGYANDLATAASLDLMRGFPPGSDQGQTRARPEIWQNLDDFQSKLNTMREQSEKLALVTTTGDKRAILKQFQKTGGTCKNCHDDYKSKDYMN